MSYKNTLPLISITLSLTFFGMGCAKNSVAQTDSVGTTPSPSTEYGKSYTFEEAGIPVEHEDIYSLKDLAYLKSVTERNGKAYIMIDPITYIDCRGLKTRHTKVPLECGQDPEINNWYAIKNTDLTPLTFEMATSAGPFLFAAPDSRANGKIWSSVNLPILATLIDGTFSGDRLTFPGYYFQNFHPEAPNTQASLFYVVRKGPVVTKVVEKYFP